MNLIMVGYILYGTTCNVRSTKHALILSYFLVFYILSRLLILGIFLLIDVFFIVAAPWCSSVISLVAILSIPEFFNSAIGMGKDVSIEYNIINHSFSSKKTSYDLI